MSVVHYRTGQMRRAACGAGGTRGRARVLPATREREAVTCQRCLHVLAAAARPPAETEAGFQGWVTDLATLCGWRWYHTHDSRRSPGGFPDLVLVRRDWLIFAELKSDSGRTTPEQDEWLDALRAVETAIASWAAKFVRVYVWRPADRPEIEAVLR